MGMPIVVDVRDVDDAAALEPLFDWFRRVDRTFSTYIADSEISRLNRGELALEDAHPDVRGCSRAARSCASRRTATSTRAPRRDGLDPSGLVKGWSVDRAARSLDEPVAELRDQRRRRHAAPGRRPPEPCWRVGIQHPLERDRSPPSSRRRPRRRDLRRLRARRARPRPAHPPAAAGVLSVTITGPDLATADAYATAAFAMGEGPAWTARLRGYEAMTLLEDDTVMYTGGFPDA